jgi:hypothetical protein
MGWAKTFVARKIHTSKFPMPTQAVFTSFLPLRLQVVQTSSPIESPLSYLLFAPTII